MLIKVLKKDCGRSAVNEFKWQKCVGNTVSGRWRTYLIKLYGIHDNATDNTVLTTVQVVHRKNTVQHVRTQHLLLNYRCHKKAPFLVCYLKELKVIVMDHCENQKSYSDISRPPLLIISS
jgi:hypothetical protein